MTIKAYGAIDEIANIIYSLTYTEAGDYSVNDCNNDGDCNDGDDGDEKRDASYGSKR